MRTISPQFIQSLKSGELSFFLDQARHNPDICMEIRKDYVSMYYKGGCALPMQVNTNERKKGWIREPGRTKENF